MEMVKRFFREEDGVVNIEYGLIAGLVALAVITMLTAMAGGINGLYQKVVTALAGAGN